MNSNRTKVALPHPLKSVEIAVVRWNPQPDQSTVILPGLGAEFCEKIAL
jgi:hypothetical protein